MYIPIEYISGSGSGSSSISSSGYGSETGTEDDGNNILLYYFLGWFILFIVIIILYYLYLCVILLYEYIKNNLFLKFKNYKNYINFKNKIFPISKCNLKHKSKIINNIGECLICLDNNNKTSIKIKCNHIFHNKCIEKWENVSIKNNNIVSCPICRTEI